MINNHSNGCYGNRSEDLTDAAPITAGHGPTPNMEMSSMKLNQTDDAHSGGQEETRGSYS